MYDKDYDEAKAMYFQYRCSSFWMEREGVTEKYRHFKVPREIEVMWTEEFKADILHRLSIETNNREITLLFWQYCDLIDEDGEKEVTMMLEFAKGNKDKLDSFSNMLLAEAIFNGFGRKYIMMRNPPMGFRKTIIEECIILLEDVKKAPFQVVDDYTKNRVGLEEITEEYLYKRIDNDLMLWEKELKSVP